MVHITGAAYAAPNKGTTSYTDLGLQNQCLILLQMVKFKDFSRPLRFSSTFQGNFYFQGLFKTVLYIQVLFKPVQTLYRRNLANSEDPDEMPHFIKVYTICLDKYYLQRKKYNLFGNNNMRPCSQYIHGPSQVYSSN